jgi:hypothetical protein
LRTSAKGITKKDSQVKESTDGSTTLEDEEVKGMNSIYFFNIRGFGDLLPSRQTYVFNKT